MADSDFDIIGKIEVDESGATSIRGVFDDIHGRMGLLSSVTDAFGQTAHFVWANLVLGAVQSVIGAIGNAISGIKDFAASCVDSAMESQNVLADLNQTLKSTGGASGMTSQELQDMAAELQNVTRFSDETIERGQAMLLTFTSIGKEVFPMATESMLDLAQKMGTDVKGAAIQLGKALNDPITGVSALRRVGVQFNDEQQAMIEKLVKSGDLMSAQKLILKELQTEFGGVAKAAGSTFAGQMDIAMNKLDNFKELVGGPLLQVMSSFKSGMLGWLMNTDQFHAVEDFLKMLNDNMFGSGMPLFEALSKTFESIGSKSDYISNLNPILHELASAFGAVQSALDSGQPMWEALWAGLRDLAIQEGPLQGVAQFFLNIVDNVWPKVRDFIASIPGYIDRIKEAAGDIAKAIGGFFADANIDFKQGKWLAGIDTLIADVINAMGDAIDKWVNGGGPQQLSDKLISWIDNLATGQGIDFDSKALVAIGHVLTALVNAVGKVKWGDIGTAIDKAFSRAIDNIDWEKMGGNLYDSASEAIGKAMLKLFKWLTSGNVQRPSDDWLLKMLAPGIYNIIHFFEDTSTGKSVIDAVGKFFQGIIDAVKRSLGISSPSTVFSQIAKAMVDGLIAGWQAGVGSFLTAIATSLTNLLPKNLKDTLSNVLSGVLNGLGGTTGGGSTGGKPGGGTTGGGSSSSSGNNIVQNFYGPVYMGSDGSTYDCPPNNPLTNSTYPNVGGHGKGR